MAKYPNPAELTPVVFLRLHAQYEGAPVQRFDVPRALGIPEALEGDISFGGGLGSPRAPPSPHGSQGKEPMCVIAWRKVAPGKLVGSCWGVKNSFWGHVQAPSHLGH